LEQSTIVFSPRSRRMKSPARNLLSRWTIAVIPPSRIRNFKEPWLPLKACHRKHAYTLLVRTTRVAPPQTRSSWSPYDGPGSGRTAIHFGSGPPHSMANPRKRLLQTSQVIRRVLWQTTTPQSNGREIVRLMSLRSPFRRTLQTLPRLSWILLWACPWARPIVLRR
jgi:hypothetical protein